MTALTSTCNVEEITASPVGISILNELIANAQPYVPPLETGKNLRLVASGERGV